MSVPEKHRMVSNTDVCTLCSGSIETGTQLDDEKQAALKRAVSVVLRVQLEDGASVCISCAENVFAVEQRMGRWVGYLSYKTPTFECRWLNSLPPLCPKLERVDNDAESKIRDLHCFFLRLYRTIEGLHLLFFHSNGGYEN